MRRYGPHGFLSAVKGYWRVCWHCLWNVIHLGPCCMVRQEFEGRFYSGFKMLEFIGCTCGRVFWTREHGANQTENSKLRVDTRDWRLS